MSIWNISLPYKAGSGIILHPAIPCRNDLFQWEQIMRNTFPASEISVCNANGFENALFFPSSSALQVLRNYYQEGGAAS